MKKHKIPGPGSKEYDIENPQNLNIPTYHSSTDYRSSKELPSVENLDNESISEAEDAEDLEVTKTNLGNKRMKTKK
ncbi:MAG: hypothetical protein P0Y49_15790 [Candidatus Pedobacter colombiensis]|uniref:Uncharacterized protein n=1 Tax=Candidatus Pedobacter colombiensis TaxID=3121371 RepID=A0AAJ5W6X9_9SPHI|nr:hypothetical protein [Pedobacter sp.]WEK18253.1 MAG: hypothetical protein P0Y49_15790 [Pedobacter sp.]